VPGGVGLVVDWQQAPDPGLGRATGFAGVVAANGLLVAVGDAGDDFQTTAWSSSDGLQWQGAPVGGGLTLLSDIAPGGPGFVAVGWEFPSGFIATSADGLNWQAVDEPAFADHSFAWVGSSVGGLVVFDDSGGAFTSPDGTIWQESDDPSIGAVADGLLDLVQDGSTLWAFSRAEDGDLIEVWRSDDAMAWTQVGTIDGSQGSQSVSAAVGPHGMVVVALIEQDAVFEALAWQSADGATWTPALNTPTDIDDVIAVAAGFVAVGHYNVGEGCALIETDDVGVTWTSVDGLAWRQMPEDGWQGREVSVLGQVDGTLIGLGVDWNEFYDGDGDSGTLWTAPLPAAATDTAPIPSPGAQPEPSPGCV
jgi:hypothetical protein